MSAAYNPHDDHLQLHVTPDHVLQPCTGYWGIALKEWEVIKQVSTMIGCLFVCLFVFLFVCLFVFRLFFCLFCSFVIARLQLEVNKQVSDSNY